MLENQPQTQSPSLSPPNKRAHHRVFARALQIHQLVAAGACPSPQQLVERLDVGLRTVKREIRFLRDELGAPLVFDRRRRGYRYHNPGWQFPFVKMSEGEMLAFFVAEHALRQTGHHAHAAELKAALAKLAAWLPGEVSVNLATLGEAVSFENLPFVTVEPLQLQRLARAAVNRETVEFDYYSPHKGERTHRRADPLLLHNFAGDWYAVSFDHQQQDMRDFHAGRISNLRETNQTFEPPPGWNAEDHLKRGFFMMRGGRLTTVSLVFDAYQAQWIRERARFHPEETREELPENQLRPSFKIGENGLAAVARWCLQYAGHCRVERPAKLKEIVREKLLKGLEQNK